jgi:hypothetical protein
MVKRTKFMTSLSTLALAARLGSNRKRGVTLIEAVLYISIALALIVGGLVFFQQASLAQRTNSAVRNISAIASETRGLYQSAATFTGFTQQTLIDAGAVPSSLVNAAGNALTNEWGGAITGVAANVDGAADDGFAVTYENVPLNACVRLASYDANGAGRVGSGIDEVRFRASAAVAAFAAQADNGTSSIAGGITPAEASVFCAAIDDAQGVDLQFLFDR